MGLVEAGALRQSAIVALAIRNVAFLLVAVIYLARSEWTLAGVVLFGSLLVWSVHRLLTRRTTWYFLMFDVCFVIAAALLEPMIVPAEIADVSITITRMIAYPTIVSVAIAERKRWSFAVLTGVSIATAAGDLLLFGSVSDTLSIFVVNWLAAIWVRRMVLRSATATDAADVRVRRARLREQVATARIRFEREQFATLHDTAASTLMLVGDRARIDPDRLAAQAARDVAVLSEASAVANARREVDLAEQIERVTSEFLTPVRVVVEKRVRVPMPIAAALTAAVREALNNVDRHSLANGVTIEIAPQQVTVSDDGVGFDPHALRSGFGLRGSIDGRMHRAGGSAVITSEPGAGTVVELTWPAPPAEEHSRASVDAAKVLRGYQYGLAIAQFIVLVQMLLFAFASATAPIGWLTSTVVVALLATTPIVVMLVRGKVRAARWLWIGLLLAAGVLYVAHLPDSQLLSRQNWVSTPGGWAIAALLAGWVSTRRRVLLAAGCVASLWIVNGAVMMWRVPTRAVAEYAGLGFASVATMQIAAIFFAWLLAESARIAERLGDEQHAAATQLAVEQALQDDYRRRFAHLTGDVINLLSGLADGSLHPEHAPVRLLAQAEYARLRRLFAQAESFEHPLIQRLRPVLDAAGERGVDVAFDIAARPPDLAEVDIVSIATAVDALVAGSEDRVRLVVSSALDQVTVSVLTTCAEQVRELVRAALVDSDYQLTVDGSLTWLRVHAPVLVPVSSTPG